MDLLPLLLSFIIYLYWVELRRLISHELPPKLCWKLCNSLWNVLWLFSGLIGP